MNEEMDNNLMDRSTQMGIDNGKRQFKKADKKANNIIKRWKSIKPINRVIIIVIVATMVGTILLCSMAWYVLKNLFFSTSTNEQYNSVASGDFNTFIQTQASTEEIKQFIEECGTTNTALRDALLEEERINKIEKWQTDTGYSGIILVAIIFVQEVPVEDLDKFLDEIYEKGLEWKDKGYETLEEIALNYVGETTANLWANSIVALISDTGILEDNSSGDGYTGIYTKTTLAPEIPKRYREYKQIQGSYKDHIWIKYTNSKGNLVTSTIYRDGCCLTSIATIVSGYKDKDISPLDIVNTISNGAGYMSSFSPDAAFSAYGLTYSRPYWHNYTELSSMQKQAIINHVATGKPVIIYVLGINGVKDENGIIIARGNSKFTSGQHWMAILDYDKANDKLYVSNPSATTSDKTGWLDSSYVLTSCTEYIAITN